MTARSRFVDAAHVCNVDECNNGDEWPVGLTNAVTARLEAVMITALLRSKSLVCSVFFSFLVAPSMCVVFCVLPLFRPWFTARHGMARLVTARLRYVNTALV